MRKSPKRSISCSAATGKCCTSICSISGSTDVDLICNRITYMAKALGVEWIILDHISILISGQAFGNNERTLIDTTMTTTAHSCAGTRTSD